VGDNTLKISSENIFVILLRVVNLYKDEGALSRYWTLKARTKKTLKVQSHALCAPKTWTLRRW